MLPSSCTSKLSTNLYQQANQVFGVFFFHSQNPFEHAPRSWIVGIDVVEHPALAIDGYSSGDQVFLDQIDQRVALNVFRMASCR
jgi:hypothetical protein